MSNPMRIRQVRPEFWTDETVATWPLGLRLFYIGLWGVCDDAGYFEYSPSRIAAVLFPYEARRTRERNVEAWLAILEESGKVRRSEGCQHALVPTLVRYQINGGRKATTVNDEHRRCRDAGYKRLDGTGRDVPSSPGQSVPIGTVSREKVGGGTEGAAAPQGARAGLAEIIGPFEAIVGKQPA